MTKQKMVVRKNTLAAAGDIWLQRDGSWGDYRTARRFPDQDKADAGARAAGIEVFGIFPVSRPPRGRV